MKKMLMVALAITLVLSVYGAATAHEGANGCHYHKGGVIHCH